MLNAYSRNTVLGHHPYTNVEGADPDIITYDRAIRRIKPWQKYHPVYLLQHLYAPVLYCLLGLKIRIEDYSVLMVQKKKGNLRVNPLTFNQKLIFYGGKVNLQKLFLDQTQDYDLTNTSIDFLVCRPVCCADSAG